MDTSQAGLQLSPFHKSGQPVVFVHYQAQQAAEDFLKIALDDHRGIGVIHGPPFSGKKTLVYQLLRSMAIDLPVAVVDGARLKTLELLRSTLAHFGLQVALESVDDYWRVLKRYLAQRSQHRPTPLLILTNINKMYPSALYALCKLAELKLDRRYALRMILMSDSPPHSIINAPSMTAIGQRVIGATELGPMTETESSRYLFAKLYASGCTTPTSILPIDIRRAIHAAAEGWPGKIDAVVINALANAEHLPLQHADLDPALTRPTRSPPPLAAVVDQDEHPDMRKLIVMLNGKMLQTVELGDSKVLIGRSEICDLTINSRFVSKHHALLVRTETALHLLDLNTTNGTFVNSRRIKSKVLQHDDVISIGNHGIKLKFPLFQSRPVIEERDLGETATMKTLDDARIVTHEESQDTEKAEKHSG